MFGVLETTPINVTSIFETAVTKVQTDTLGMIAVALPAALIIAGVVLSIKIAWKTFRGIS